MKNRLIINNELEYKFLFEKEFNLILDFIGQYLKIKKSIELSLTIVNDLSIKELNKKYRNIDKVTDVLSFGQDYKSLEKVINFILLGDIYISYEKIKEQSIDYGHDIKREWCYIFAHGITHLFGFDHLNKTDEDKMNVIVDLAMKEIGVNR